jgi:hypothetical protein
MRYTDAYEFQGTEAEYRALPGVSASMLRCLFRHGPERYQAGRVATGPALTFGSLVHSLVLTPESMPYAAYPGAVRRGKEWEAWKAEHEGLTIVTQSEMEDAVAMAASVASCPDAVRALTGRKEVAIVAQHPASGAQVKGRIDCKTPLGITDLKTARDAGPKKFVRDAAEDGLVVQAAMYCALTETLTGDPATEFRWVAVDKRSPYPVAVYVIDSDDLARGGALCERLIGQWVKWERDGWPRHYGIKRFYFPDWAFDGAEVKPEERPKGEAFGGAEPMTEDELNDIF